MPDPFPGIDPYRESLLWEGFHSRFVTYFGDALNSVLPETYVAELGEQEADICLSQVSDATYQFPSAIRS